MTEENPVAAALELLAKKRASLSDELRQVDEAIASLEKLVGKRAPATAGYDRNRPSVRTKLVTLLEEQDRDWSAGEVLDEYERRGDPVHGQDPANALRAALADAKKRGMIVRTDVGRYKAAKWRTQLDDPAARPATPPNGSEGTAEKEAGWPGGWPGPSKEVTP